MPQLGATDRSNPTPSCVAPYNIFIEWPSSSGLRNDFCYHATIRCSADAQCNVQNRSITFCKPSHATTREVLYRRRGRRHLYTTVDPLGLPPRCRSLSQDSVNSILHIVRGTCLFTEIGEERSWAWDPDVLCSCSYYRSIAEICNSRCLFTNPLSVPL